MFPNGKKEGHRQQDGSLYKLFPMKKAISKNWSCTPYDAYRAGVPVVTHRVALLT
jgi:hypothetical protein